VFIVIVQPIALRTIRGFSHVQWIAAGALFVGVGLGVTAFAGGAIVYALGVVLWTMGDRVLDRRAGLRLEIAPVDQRSATGDLPARLGHLHTSARRSGRSCWHGSDRPPLSGLSGVPRGRGVAPPVHGTASRRGRLLASRGGRPLR
jgi:hypothetical protein